MYFILYEKEIVSKVKTVEPMSYTFPENKENLKQKSKKMKETKRMEEEKKLEREEKKILK